MNEQTIKKNDLMADIKKYLHKIGNPPLAFQRVKYYLNQYKNFTDQDVERIFISDFVNGDENHALRNLWFFSDTYMMEMKDFLVKQENKMDFNKFKNKITYLEITKNYDFDKEDDNSWLYVYFKLTSTIDVAGELRATGKNCGFLSNIIREIIIPNFAD